MTSAECRVPKGSFFFFSGNVSITLIYFTIDFVDSSSHWAIFAKSSQRCDASFSTSFGMSSLVFSGFQSGILSCERRANIRVSDGSREPVFWPQTTGARR